MFFFSRKAWSMDYKWKFFKSARCVQVKLDSGADVAAVGELDEKLWTVLSASTDALRFDADTLRLLDSDGDGRIRVPEVRVAVAWLKKRFRNLDFLLARKDEISLADLDDSTDEGKALLASFKNILARAGRADDPPDRAVGGAAPVAHRARDPAVAAVGPDRLDPEGVGQHSPGRSPG
jgi:hypothetical protein